MEIASYRQLCSQLEAQISMMHDKEGMKVPAGAHEEDRERAAAAAAGSALAKVSAWFCVFLLRTEVMRGASAPWRVGWEYVLTVVPLFFRD